MKKNRGFVDLEFMKMCHEQVKIDMTPKYRDTKAQIIFLSFIHILRFQTKNIILQTKCIKRILIFASNDIGNETAVLLMKSVL